ncbi:MAG: hypothetical protein JXR73_08690 [Candidatus Omnitrophica bacterium]|nr:hypothetical protein [Candidatus Omnitrophota bacterium]
MIEKWIMARFLFYLLIAFTAVILLIIGVHHNPFSKNDSVADLYGEILVQYEESRLNDDREDEKVKEKFVEHKQSDPSGDLGVLHEKASLIPISEFPQFFQSIAFNMDSTDFQNVLPEAIYCDYLPSSFSIDNPSEDFFTIYFDFTSNLSDNIRELRNYLLEKYPPEKVNDIASMNESEKSDFLQLIQNLKSLEAEQKTSAKWLYRILMKVNLEPDGQKIPADFDSRPIVLRYLKQFGEPNRLFVSERFEKISQERKYSAGMIWNRDQYNIMLSSAYKFEQDKFSNISIHIFPSYYPLSKIVPHRKIYDDDNLHRDSIASQAMQSLVDCVINSTIN